MKQLFAVIVSVCGWFLFAVSILCFAMVIPPMIVIVLLLDFSGKLLLAFLVAGILLLPSAIGLVHWGTVLRRERVRHGFCRKCGYDLRGRRLGEEFPECGTPV